MSEGRASRDDDRPDLKWVVEWLVEREGQRKTAALLGVQPEDGGSSPAP